MAETAKERVLAVYPKAIAYYNNCGMASSYWSIRVGEDHEISRTYCGAIAGDTKAWEYAASTLPPTAAEPTIPDPWNQKHTVTAAEPSEPKADGFDVWHAREYPYETEILAADPSTYHPKSTMGGAVRDARIAHDSQQKAYQAGEQSGVRKGMQRALEQPVRSYNEFVSKYYPNASPEPEADALAEVLSGAVTQPTHSAANRETTWVPVYVERAICDLIPDEIGREIARDGWAWDNKHPDCRNALNRWKNEAIRQRVELIAFKALTGHELEDHDAR